MHIKIQLYPCRDRKKETARTVIERKFKDIIIPESTCVTDQATLLKYHLNANDEANFLNTLEGVSELETLDNKADLLESAVAKNLRRATRELLRRSTLNSAELVELCRIAIERAHPDILKELLGRNPRLADALILPASRELVTALSPGPGHRNNRFRCFKIVMDQSEVNVRQQDGKTDLFAFIIVEYL